ncbi:MAG: hypothetical protein GY826_24915, partial [Fuerstiella sp.]|nr:hypothetical protein [Fuerstiella sp.]
SFAPEQPKAVAYGTLLPSAGRRMVGDTINLHAPRNTGFVRGGQRLVEVVVNGRVAGSKSVAADGKIHDLEFTVPIHRSSWVAIRQFPQLHTNPVNVIIDNQPIRASRESALWCAEAVRLLWHNRRQFISEAEQPAAKIAYTNALERFFGIADESDANSRKVNRFALQ